LGKLGVDLVDVDEFNGCGYPVRYLHIRPFLLSSARNLALAEKLNLPLMTLCKCCYGSLRKADHLLKENTSLRKEINHSLENEGLKYEGSIEITHFLYVLHGFVGLEASCARVTLYSLMIL
jgi:heterodisulfide reductase subunit B